MLQTTTPELTTAAESLLVCDVSECVTDSVTLPPQATSLTLTTPTDTLPITVANGYANSDEWSLQGRTPDRFSSYPSSLDIDHTPSRDIATYPHSHSGSHTPSLDNESGLKMQVSILKDDTQQTDTQVCPLQLACALCVCVCVCVCACVRAGPSSNY